MSTYKLGYQLCRSEIKLKFYSGKNNLPCKTLYFSLCWQLFPCHFQVYLHFHVAHGKLFFAAIYFARAARTLARLTNFPRATSSGIQKIYVMIGNNGQGMKLIQFIQCVPYVSDLGGFLGFNTFYAVSSFASGIPYIPHSLFIGHFSWVFVLSYIYLLAP